MAYLKVLDDHKLNCNLKGLQIFGQATNVASTSDAAHVPF
jgi:hypothetical protein